VGDIGNAIEAGRRMKCANCKQRIPPDEETYVQGEALCEACWKQSLKQTWGWTWWLLGGIAGAFVLVFFGAFCFSMLSCAGIIGGTSGR
jgi:recombinational DNA repair protein (RecF pathway)